MEHTLLAAKIHDDNTRISYYSKQLLTMIQKEFRTKKIDRYDYSAFVTILNCLDLQTTQTRERIEEFIKEEARKEIKIDMVI